MLDPQIARLLEAYPAIYLACHRREEVIDTNPGEDSWEDEVEKYYSAEEFKCPTCDLHLDSRQEIEAVGLDADHTEVETRERQYEPDYGNC
jgi:hypothetical protein